MTAKPRILYRIAVALGVLNVAGAGFAIARSEALHAGVHAALALAFGLWAQWLLRPRGATADQADAPEQIAASLQAQLDALAGEMSVLRRELSETQERLDFAERVLTREREQRRVGPQRET